MADYDVVIIGAGLAGLTAGFTAARHGLRVGLVDRMGSGGQILNVDRLEGLPGFPEGVAGYEFGPILQEQAETAGVEFILDTVVGIEVEGDDRIVHGTEGDLQTTTVIVATGSSFRTLGIPGEARFVGHGVSNCASCDGPFFGGDRVAVVGGGDSAIEEAEVLTGHVDQVLVFNRGETFSAQQALVDCLADKSNVELYHNSEVTEIVGEDTVTAVRVHNILTGETRDEAVAGVFVFIGLEPNTHYLNGLVDLDSGGHVVTDLMMQTSVAGIFAAGDIRQGSVSLLPSVMGDGATAAVAAYRYIRGL